ncbi:proline-rich protein 2-like [Suricata suricatta]|uniref:proline-rich protein 2-like n=1 Tax=Suricata suricatta TaxID=37032 RepID=UPI001155AF4C|nr:proline-rich protein 2-like [Suricata suricatta]
MGGGWGLPRLALRPQLPGSADAGHGSHPSPSSEDPGSEDPGPSSHPSSEDLGPSSQDPGSEDPGPELRVLPRTPAPLRGPRYRLALPPPALGPRPPLAPRSGSGDRARERGRKEETSGQREGVAPAPSLDPRPSPPRTLNPDAPPLTSASGPLAAAAAQISLCARASVSRDVPPHSRET